MSLHTLHTSEQRITEWRKFRAQITDVPLDTMLFKVSEFFKNFPFSSRCIDYYEPATWLSPWEILHHESYCTNTISLLMYHSVRLSNSTVGIDIWLIDENGDMSLIPVISGKYMLNYILGKVVSFEEYRNNFKVIKIYKTSDIKQII